MHPARPNDGRTCDGKATAADPGYRYLRLREAARSLAGPRA